MQVKQHVVGTIWMRERGAPHDILKIRIARVVFFEDYEHAESGRPIARGRTPFVSTDYPRKKNTPEGFNLQQLQADLDLK